MKNHLGNVCVVITDLKKWVDDGDNIPEGGEMFASVASYNNFYSFGAPQPSRTYNQYTGADGYRYSFNGKENDPETVGTAGGTQDYGFRIYNPSLGKFLSVDPIAKSYPWNSVYAFAENDVIRAIDLDGLEKYIVKLADSKGKTWLSINPRKDEWGKGLYKYEGEERIYSVKEGFQRGEESKARMILDNARDSDTQGETMGVEFGYQIKPEFGRSSSKITNEDELSSDFQWLADRLNNNSTIEVQVSANVATSWADGSTDGLKPHNPEDVITIDGMKTTAENSTILRGNSIKQTLTTKFSVNKDQVNVTKGELLLGATNRVAKLKFKTK